MSWIAVGVAGAGLAGSVYSANKNADAMEAANSGDLPDWLKPYVVGDGPMPGFVENPGKINTNWLDYITKLGQGGEGAEWQPMSSDNMFFHPEQQFTPEPGGGPYGQLPPGMNQPPPQQQQGGGMDIDALTNFLKQKQAAMFAGGEGAQYGNTGSLYGNMRRLGNDMSYGEMDKMNELAQLLGR